jgi:hypothetical protein
LFVTGCENLIKHVYPIPFYKGLAAKAQVHQRQSVIRFDGAGEIFPRLLRRKAGIFGPQGTAMVFQEETEDSTIKR